MIKYLRNIINKGSERTVEAKKNIALSLVLKGVSILVSLLLVPMTINYVNPTQYGIWLTLSSVIGWIGFFDLGLGNGFRNRFAEAKANGDLPLARQYLSTTYFALTIIVSFVFVLAIIGNNFVDWSHFLKVSATYREELHRVFAIICIFFCINMVANVFSTLLTADQKPAWSAMILSGGQVASLVAIYLLTVFTHGSLYNLALYYSGAPVVVLVVSSVVMFRFSRYRMYAPRFSDIRKGLIKNILGLGGWFFLIYICLIAVFQIVNIVISREISPLAVTQYNIANKYFNVLYMVTLIIITPFWSAFTDAYAKGDVAWMKNVTRKLEYYWLGSIVVVLIMLALANPIYSLWVGKSVEVPFSVSVGMAVFVVTQSIGNIYMYLINGIGKIRIQTIAYVVLALISWPVLTWGCRNYGIAGALIIPSCAYIFQGILGRIQLNKIISKEAFGIWNR